MVRTWLGWVVTGEKKPQSMRVQVHPADFLNEVLMPAMGKSDGDVASLLGMSLPLFYMILTREKPITRSTAAVLGRLFGTGRDFWLEAQTEHDRNTEPQKKTGPISHPRDMSKTRSLQEDCRASMSFVHPLINRQPRPSKEQQSRRH